MIVIKNTWHHRAWKWMTNDATWRQDPPPTFCDYWSTVLIGLPVSAIVFALIVTLLSPVFLLVWLLEKFGLSQRLKTVTLCPWGKIEFREK
jgi:hypothetical protein